MDGKGNSLNRRKFLSLGIGAAAAPFLPDADLLANPSSLPELPDVFAIAGPAKSGKSLLAAELAVARAGGRPTFLGRFSVTQGKTLLLDDQHSPAVIGDRFRRIASPRWWVENGTLFFLRRVYPDDLREYADRVMKCDFKHVIVDSMSIFDDCTYTFRDSGETITQPMRFDREFRRHIGEGVFTDLLRERGITCAFTRSQNTEPISDDLADCVRRDNDERHETRDAIVVHRPLHGPRGVRIHGRGAFAKVFAQTGEPHRVNSNSLRFEKIS